MATFEISCLAYDSRMNQDIMLYWETDAPTENRARQQFKQKYSEPHIELPNESQIRIEQDVKSNEELRNI